MTNSAWFGMWWGCDPCVWSPPPVPAGTQALSITAWLCRTSTLNRKKKKKSYILMTWENGGQWHIYKRESCSIHTAFEENTALFRPQQAFALMWERCAEWLTEALFRRSGRGPRQPATVKKPGQRTSRRWDKKALWAWLLRRWGRPGLSRQHGRPCLTQHYKTNLEMLTCGFVWNKHRSKCCEGYRRSMRDEGALLESSPLLKPGSSMGKAVLFLKYTTGNI